MVTLKKYITSFIMTQNHSLTYLEVLTLNPILSSIDFILLAFNFPCQLGISLPLPLFLTFTSYKYFRKSYSWQGIDS